MLNPVIHRFQYGKHEIKIETNMIARKATSSAMVSMDDTVVFVSVVGMKQEKPEQSFFPLTVNYQERTYAAGRFPGTFFRREGRPSEGEILISRLIDRPIRPLFPEDFLNEVQITVTVMSVNPQINPDIVAMIGAFTTLSLSGIPFKGPIGAARVGYINNQYVLNPTQSEMIESRLDLIVSGTKRAVLMVELEAKLLNEEQILNAIMYGHEQQQTVIENIKKIVHKIGNPKWTWEKCTSTNEDLYKKIEKSADPSLKEAYKIIDRQERANTINRIKEGITSTILKDNSIHESKIKQILSKIEKKIIRKQILSGKPRIDGREKDSIRSIDARVGILPRTHGSALFTRGETQSLATVTLGTDRDAQNVDELTGEKTDRFLLHYNFPPYCVGEIGTMGFPKRREIGHGRLAKRSILAVMPKMEEFPYTIRVVSEIMESNGSSSMASVCSASLALMDAGVPIKSAVAGIAMGLVKEKNKFVVLSDILGDEDQIGDMDFKVAGSLEGITALQMDIKIEGIDREIMNIALQQARLSRIQILSIMKKAIHQPRKNISKFAPRFHKIKIDPENIRKIIGKGGSVIRSLTEETNSKIDIEEDGTIKIASTDKRQALFTIQRIEEIIMDVIVGKTYIGRITKIVSFGIFVSIFHNREGLIHISQISERKIEKIRNHFKIGQTILVKVLEIDRRSRIHLSAKEIRK